MACCRILRTAFPQRRTSPARDRGICSLLSRNGHRCSSVPAARWSRTRFDVTFASKPSVYACRLRRHRGSCSGLFRSVCVAFGARALTMHSSGPLGHAMMLPDIFPANGRLTRRYASPNRIRTHTGVKETTRWPTQDGPATGLSVFPTAQGTVRG